MATTQKIQPLTTNPATGTNSLYKQNSPWERMLTQMLMAQRLGSRGMAGFALGQILAKLLTDWKTRYDFRGDVKDRYSNLSPEDRAKQLAEDREKNPAYADRVEAFLKERGFDFGTTPQTQPQPQGTPALGANQQLFQPQPQATNPIRTALNQEMPNTDWQQQQPQLLGSADDWQKTLEDLARRRTYLGGVTYGL